MLVIEPFVRAVLLLGGSWISQKITTPPAKGTQNKENKEFWLTTAIYYMKFQQLWSWHVTLAEISLTYLFHTDKAKFDDYCPNSAEASNFPRASTALYVALGFLFAGGILRFWAIRQLGEFFTYQIQEKKGHRLIQSGLYSLMRHPSYTGYMIFAMAYPFVFVRSGGPIDCYSGTSVTVFKIVLGAISMLWPFALMPLRVKTEERALQEMFPEEYPKYMQRVRRFVPVIPFPGN